MNKDGLKLVPNANTKAIVKADDGTLTLQLDDGSEHKGFNQVVMAIGRTPLTEPLHLDKAGVTLQVLKLNFLLFFGEVREELRLQNI
jgi:glutathione reductase (NADPH)